MFAPTLGAEASLLLRKLPFGFIAGAMSAPTTSKEQLGRHYNMGGYCVLLAAVTGG
jgi:hypothetical protein